MISIEQRVIMATDALHDLDTELFVERGITDEPGDIGPDGTAGGDIHGYYTFDVARTGLVLPGGVKALGEKVVLHVQTFPGMSTDTEMRSVSWWLEQALVELSRGSRSFGNEHDARVRGVPWQQVSTPWGFKPLLDPILELLP